MLCKRSMESIIKEIEEREGCTLDERGVKCLAAIRDLEQSAYDQGYVDGLKAGGAAE